jgi:hypothetical protein
MAIKDTKDHNTWHVTGIIEGVKFSTCQEEVKLYFMRDEEHYEAIFPLKNATRRVFDTMLSGDKIRMRLNVHKNPKRGVYFRGQSFKLLGERDVERRVKDLTPPLFGENGDGFACIEDDDIEVEED